MSISIRFTKVDQLRSQLINLQLELRELRLKDPNNKKAIINKKVYINEMKAKLRQAMVEALLTGD